MATTNTGTTTRKTNATKRSTAAKKAAQTRAANQTSFGADPVSSHVPSSRRTRSPLA